MNPEPGHSNSLRAQMRLFAVMSIIVLVATGILSQSNIDLFQRFFGTYYPPAIILVVACLGAAAVWFLSMRTQFVMMVPGRWARGLLFSTMVATMLVLPTILVDMVRPFSEDMNAALPEALLFYPIMGYVVEITFHLVPLALLLGFAGRLFYWKDTSGFFWICAPLVATLEPGFQVWAGWTDQGWSWQATYLSVHLFLFNLLQFYALRQFGFVHMYLFRMVYYLHWHILWGTARLSLLF
jgi:hypothetical protein